jgi:phospholipid-transporting ATPase
MRDLVDIPREQEYEFKAEGLRIACCSYRVFSAGELKKFQDSFQRDRRDRDKVTELVRKVEENGTFLCLVAFEEEPNPGALKLIHQAKAAGIQLILTSALKLESVAMTALSLGVLTNSQYAAILRGDSEQSVSDSVADLLNSPPYDALAITGSAIEFLPSIQESSKLASLIKGVRVILLEKIDPWQVGQFVRYLRKKCGQTVLGLGQNVCDSLYMQRSSVSMSMTLDEVSPCDLACDISVKRLESVSKMLLVNGGLLRERLHALLNYIFPRNTVFGLLQCVYGIYSGVTGTPLFLGGSVIFVLLFATMLPAVSRAIFNQKAPPALLQVSPQRYKHTRVKRLPWYRFVLVNLLSGIAAVLLLGGSALILRDVRRPYGDTFSHAQFSFAVGSSFVVCCMCFHVPTCNTWTRWHHVWVWGSLIMYFVIIRASTDGDPSGQLRGSVQSVTEVALYWFMLALYAGISFFLMMSFELFRRLPGNQCGRGKAESSGPMAPLMSDFGSVVKVSELYRSEQTC